MKNRKWPVEYEIKEHIFTSACYHVQRLLRDVRSEAWAWGAEAGPDCVKARPDILQPILVLGLGIYILRKEFITCKLIIMN